MNLQDRLADLYQQMGAAYDTVSDLLNFSCDQCPDNCCDSFFLHHTYIEWAYLQEGFEALPGDKQALYLERARNYINASQQALVKGERPTEMCPVNDNGRCGLYEHRLLICRLHGVPASLTVPDGKKHNFPGCFRCQELTEGKENVTTMDRTKFFREMVGLEQEFLKSSSRPLPKVKMTLAEMLVNEPGVKF